MAAPACCSTGPLPVGGPDRYPRHAACSAATADTGRPRVAGRRVNAAAITVALVPAVQRNRVEKRRLADYDTALGVAEAWMAWEAARKPPPGT